MEEEERGWTEEGTWRARLRSNPTADCNQPGREKEDGREGRKRRRAAQREDRDVRKVEKKEALLSVSVSAGGWRTGSSAPVHAGKPLV